MRHASGPILSRVAFRSGGARLTGEVRVTGAKNSVLKLMAAALLRRGHDRAHARCRTSSTSSIMAELLRRLGCEVGATRGRRTVAITVPEVPAHKADYDLVRRMRASINVLGPLLARCGEADVALPGGDAIGSRALDMHVGRARAARGDGRAASTASSSPTRAERLHGAHDLAGLPERRRDREPAHGRGPRRRARR